MPRHLPPDAVWLAVGVLAFAACGDDTPTQPSDALAPAATAPSLATVSNSWRSVAPMPGAMGSGSEIGVVPSSGGLSKAYVFGGTNDAGGSGAVIRVYDVASNTWGGIRDPFNNRVFAFDLNGVGNIKDKLYFSGGKDYGSGELWMTNAVWSFDPVTETLRREADMPLRTADGVSGVIGDRLYVLPGTCFTVLYPDPGYCQHEPIRKLFRYNPATRIWATMAPAPHHHASAVGGVISNKFYVAGGYDDRFLPTSKLDVYDPATNTWRTLAPMPGGFTAVAGTVLQGQLFVVGTSSGGIRHYAYNPTSNRWNPKAAPSTLGGTAAKVFLDGKARMLLLLGGTVDHDAESELYTP